MKQTIITPRVPNFIRVQYVSGGNEHTHPLTDFTDEELDEIAKNWRFDLYGNRERQKNNS